MQPLKGRSMKWNRIKKKSKSRKSKGWEILPWRMKKLKTLNILELTMIDREGLKIKKKTKKKGIFCENEESKMLFRLDWLCKSMSLRLCKFTIQFLGRKLLLHAFSLSSFSHVDSWKINSWFVGTRHYKNPYDCRRKKKPSLFCFGLTTEQDAPAMDVDRNISVAKWGFPTLFKLATLTTTEISVASAIKYSKLNPQEEWKMRCTMLNTLSIPTKLRRSWRSISDRPCYHYKRRRKKKTWDLDYCMSPFHSFL